MARHEAHAFNSAPGRQWQVDLYEIQTSQGLQSEILSQKYKEEEKKEKKQQIIQ